MRWSLLVGLPILVVWVIGCPVIVLVILTKNRHNLESWKIKKYFLIIYQGLRPQAYYWEFVATFRKFAILSANALTNNYSPNYKIFISVCKLYFLTNLAVL